MFAFDVSILLIRDNAKMHIEITYGLVDNYEI